MKTLTNNAGQKFKLGRIQPSTRRLGLSMKDLLSANVLPQITLPTSTNYGAKATQSLNNIYLNGSLSDCVVACGFHCDGVTSGNNGSEVLYTDAQVIQNYSAIGGYNPNAPLVSGENESDNGCSEEVAISYWEANGFPSGRWLKRAITLDPNNIEEIRTALYLFENICFNINLPDAWIDPFPSGNNFVWGKNGEPDQMNGHSFLGYDILANGNLAIDTWGILGEITPEAISYYGNWSQGGQLFTFLLPDMFYRLSKKSPIGYDENILIDFLNKL